MKNLFILTSVLLVISLCSCSEEEPNFVGVFELSEQEFRCPDRNLKLDVGTHGFCVPDSDAEKCLRWEYEINLDGTYEELLVSTTILGGLMLSQPARTEGTYTTEGHVISLRSSGGTVTELMIDELETTLTGFVGTPTESGCRFYSTLTKI